MPQENCGMANEWLVKAAKRIAGALLQVAELTDFGSTAARELGAHTMSNAKPCKTLNFIMTTVSLG
jgi:hypothetical protein